MSKIIVEHTVSFTYRSTIDPETGEILSSEVISKKKPSKKAPVEESDEPKLTLEENKYKLTSAAVELLKVSPDDKIDIKYEKRGKNIIPVIASDDVFGTKQGNRLTKAYTVACRGNKNNELRKYGTEFTLLPHPEKEDIFILSTGKELPEEESSEEEELDDIENIDLQSIIDDPDVIESSIFQL